VVCRCPGRSEGAKYRQQSRHANQVCFSHFEAILSIFNNKGRKLASQIGENTRVKYLGKEYAKGGSKSTLPHAIVHFRPGGVNKNTSHFIRCALTDRQLVLNQKYILSLLKKVLKSGGNIGEHQTVTVEIRVLRGAFIRRVLRGFGFSRLGSHLQQHPIPAPQRF
jgi:hypothetical protein